MRRIKWLAAVIALVILSLGVVCFVRLSSSEGDVGIWPNVLDIRLIDEVPPSCIVLQDEQGIRIRLQDRGGGLDTVSPLEVQNASLDIPFFRIGSRSPLTVTVSKVVQQQSSRLILESRDIGGNTVRCPPVEF